MVSKSKYYPAIFGIILIASAIHLNINLIAAINNADDPKIILDDELFLTAPRDQVSINKVVLRGDNLTLKVSYGGGCEEHDFALIAQTTNMSILPIHVFVLLSHNANGDNCLAWLSRDLTFNLVPLKRAHSKITDTIIIHLIGVEQLITYKLRSVIATTTTVTISEEVSANTDNPNVLPRVSRLVFYVGTSIIALSCGMGLAYFWEQFSKRK